MLGEETLNFYFANVGFEVLTLVVIKSSVFCDITPYSPLKVNRSFWEKCRLHLQQVASRTLLATCFTLVSCLAYSSTLKMEAICSSETPVDFQRTYTALYPRRWTLHNFANVRVLVCPSILIWVVTKNVPSSTLNADPIMRKDVLWFI
jgi:hypothetical protein